MKYWLPFFAHTERECPLKLTPCQLVETKVVIANCKHMSTAYLSGSFRDAFDLICRPRLPSEEDKLEFFRRLNVLTPEDIPEDFRIMEFQGVFPEQHCSNAPNNNLSAVSKLEPLCIRALCWNRTQRHHEGHGLW
jgi:hypothetical protein